MPTLREAVDAARIKRGLSVSALADGAGVHRARLSEWLRGKIELRTAALEKVAGFLRLELRTVRHVRRAEADPPLPAPDGASCPCS